MKIVINSKDSKLNKLQEDNIQKKFKDIPKILKRFTPEQKIVNIRTEQGARWGYKINFSMWLPRKKHIFAEVKGKNFTEAVDKLKDQVVRQVTDYKEKISENTATKKTSVKN